MPSAQHVMLAVHLKRTEQLDIKTPILTYIRNTYSDAEADKAVEDLQAVQGLRNELVSAQTSATGVPRKETLAQYYKSLATVETRFPISGEKGHVKLAFPWADAFRTSKKTSQANVHFEKAAVLFNLAALTSQQALQVERGTADGITQACKLFQEAAGTFAYLRDREANKVDAPIPVDLTTECCGLMEKLMMAQAQECVFHKALMDGKSPGVAARLAKQAAIMYGEVTALFTAPLLSQHFEKSWAAHTQMKGSLMDVLSLVESAKQLQSETKISKEIATLSEAFTRLQATKKLAKAVSQELSDSLRPLEETMALALRKAQKDNDAVYLEKVPPFADLPPVQGACLVNAAPPANLDASGENLFSSLVPDASAKALSKYSDLVDAAVREALDTLAAAAEAARAALKEAELPDLLDALDGRVSAASVPPALARELEDIQNIGGASHLRGIMNEISDLRRNVEADLNACQKPLDEEAAADAAARAQFGERWTVPPSAALAKPLADKIGSYRSTMTQAAESDARVARRLADNESAFAALTPEAAASQMPRLTAPPARGGGFFGKPAPTADPAVVVASLRRDMEALSKLATERSAIEEAIKDTKARDNILPKLMATPSSGYDALFAAEAAKFTKLRDDAAAAATRTQEALAAVAGDAQAFRSVFAVDAWRASCEGGGGPVRTALRTYREVLDHLSEGLRFYMSLQEAVKEHQQQCSDFAFTRGLQRDELRAELARGGGGGGPAVVARGIAGLGIGGGAPQQQAPLPPATGYPPYPYPSQPAAPYPQQPPAPYGAPPPAGGAAPQPQQQYAYPYPPYPGGQR